jgi:dTDP-D-glucose 4,6-dehydratase
MKKLLDTIRMTDYVEIDPIEVEEGIKQTVEWYINNKAKADAKK